MAKSLIDLALESGTAGQVKLRQRVKVDGSITRTYSLDGLTPAQAAKLAGKLATSAFLAALDAEVATFVKGTESEKNGEQGAGGVTSPIRSKVAARDIREHLGMVQADGSGTVPDAIQDRTHAAAPEVSANGAH